MPRKSLSKVWTFPPLQSSSCPGVPKRCFSHMAPPVGYGKTPNSSCHLSGRRSGTLALWRSHCRTAVSESPPPPAKLANILSTYFKTHTHTDAGMQNSTLQTLSCLLHVKSRDTFLFQISQCGSLTKQCIQLYIKGSVYKNAYIGENDIQKSILVGEITSEKMYVCIRQKWHTIGILNSH